MNRSTLPLIPKSNLTPEQVDLVNSPIGGSVLLSGEAGCGKTTAGAQRLRYLAEQGISGDSILVLVPQRSLAAAYYAQVQALDFPSASSPAILTFGGLAQRMVSLFWPVIARHAGFKNPSKPCRFLTLETAQYYLAALVEPLLAQGYFESLTIDPNRLYSQIIDNLNKSAVVGFPPGEISTRLTQAWAGKPAQTIVYRQGQECALLFRDFCYKNNLLDFSLQLSVFVEHLWPSLVCNQYLKNTYHHLIYDNIEEDIPIAHDLIADWLPNFESALLIQDTEGGFRTFLGADPESSHRFSSLCSQKVKFSSSLTKTHALESLQNALSESILDHKLGRQYFSEDAIFPFSIHSFRFYPEVITWVSGEVSKLIHEESVPPSEIAILTPFLSDALRFTFSSHFNDASIPFSTYRPSRSLRDEPAVHTVLTLAKLANPGWEMVPTRHEVRSALMGAIEGCDLVRADILTMMLYKPSDDSARQLKSFDPVNPAMQSRITYLIGERYERLRQWLLDNSTRGVEELDHWISRLFGEILSQPGFGFHTNFESARVVSQMVESCRKFRQVLQFDDDKTPAESSREYVRALEQGILAAQSLATTTDRTQSESVFLSPAFSFLMTNRPVKYQFWIDIGSQGWWSRLDQPLTQPFVLNRNWPAGKLWTDLEEVATNQQTLAKISSGLIRRCSTHIYMCTLGFNEQGMEERGALLMAMQNILRQINQLKGVGNV